VQTLDRSYFTFVTEPSSCEQAAIDKKKGRTEPQLKVTDRVRLDVAEGEGLEIHSWPSASRFETGDIDEPITRGPSSTGSFGGYLVDIFDNDGAQFDFVHDKAEAGHILTYSYRVTEEMSHYKIRTDDGWVIAPYEGTFDIDAESLDLLRISVNTLELPRETGLCEAQSSLEYASVPMGSGNSLVPRQSQLRFIHRGTLETNSTSVVSNCREYRPGPTLSVASDALIPKSSLTLLPGTMLALQLNAAIDTDVAAAGDPVTATVTAILKRIPNPMVLGAMVHGRISRMEHWSGDRRSLQPSAPGASIPPGFMVAIHWDSISKGEDSEPSAAIARKILWTAPGPTVGEIAGRQTNVADPHEILPVFRTGAKRYIVPAGYRMEWETVAPQPKIYK
jgi:hypothetical protein